MNVVETSSFLIYFGSSQNCLKNRLESPLDSFLNLKRLSNARNLVFAAQVHGIDGIVIGDDFKMNSPIILLKESADMLLNARKGIGIGVYTADCLPVVIIDTKKNASCIVHAGWKGSLKGIVTQACLMMARDFKSNIHDLKIYFGPSAKVCCYEVSADFALQVPKQYHEKCIITRNGSTYFDLVSYNVELLASRGIDRNAIDFEANECTICNIHYCSYRREKKKGRSQASIVVLK